MKQSAASQHNNHRKLLQPSGSQKKLAAKPVDLEMQQLEHE